MKIPARLADAVSIDTIDAQHQNLSALARELHAAMSTGRGKAAMGAILTQLVDYTKAHFKHEEQWMQLYRYPEFERHRAGMRR